ncbi:MAG: pantetheine-phosphate adenylyltransferase [Clostridia bacterium]|nr:pantetheine-phosphate adenylyltransferase [Clostridia bacterium]
MKTWICPGSFDPVTSGHIDIIKRAAKMCDRLIVAIGINDKKAPFLTAGERRRLLEKSIAGIPNAEVDEFQGLLIEYARKMEAAAIVKGLRAVSDYEYELQMALLNKRLDEGIETIFLMSGINFSFLSSRAVRELASNGGDIRGLVPDEVLDDIMAKYR